MKNAVKRGFDLICSLLALLLLSPIFLLSAVCVRLSSPGPIFYRARRVGKDGNLFDMLKFRSMHVVDGAKERGYIADEKRIFPWGSFMRKSKIDELPQLLAILKGEMSIVGPRPYSIQGADELLLGEYQEILSVRPGLTSYASLYDYKHGELFIHDNQQYLKEVQPVKMELELYYVRNWSLGKDLLLIIKTVGNILQIILGQKQFPYNAVERQAMAAVEQKRMAGSK